MDNFADGQKGALGDLRVLGTHVDNASKRFLPFKDGFPLMCESVFTDWGFSGPRAVKEYLGSIHESGTDIGNYHLQWAKNSGVNQHSAVCHEHRNLVESLRLGITKDQIDPSNLMMCELMVRRLVQLEVAVTRNPNNPDYSGLEVLLENPLSEGGAAITRGLDEWVTSRLKERAQIAKQARLFREETSLAGRGKGTSSSGGGDADDGDASFWRKKKKRPKAKAGAGTGGAGAKEG